LRRFAVERFGNGGQAGIDRIDFENVGFGYRRNIVALLRGNRSGEQPGEDEREYSGEVAM